MRTLLIFLLSVVVALMRFVIELGFLESIVALCAVLHRIGASSDGRVGKCLICLDPWWLRLALGFGFN